MKNSLKPLVRSLLLVLGLSPLSFLSAEPMMEERSSSQSNNEQAVWSPIYEWISNSEKESLLSDYYAEFESINESTILLGSSEQASVKTMPGHLNTVSTSVSHASVKHPAKITSITKTKEGNVSIVTPSTPSHVSLHLMARAFTFVTTNEKSMSIMSDKAAMTVETQSGKKTIVAAGKYYAIPAHTTMRIITASPTTLTTTNTMVKVMLKVVTKGASTISVTTLTTHPHPVMMKVKSAHMATTVTHTSDASQVTTKTYAPKVKLATLPLPEVFSKSVVQPTYYAPQLNLGGFYGTSGESYAEADVWVPVWQRDDEIVYADLRYQKNEYVQQDMSAGLGYRHLSEEINVLYDVYSFYNRYTSGYNNTFQQVMIGGAIRNLDWTLRGNYYFSIGTTEYSEDSLDNLSFKSLGGIRNEGLISYGFEQNSVNGGVIELGRTIPHARGLSLFGGYYGFASTSTHPFVNGVRGRAEYVLDEAFNFKVPFLKHITLESMFQYDNVNKGVVTVGARLSIPLGKSSTHSKLQEAMTDYVHFYPRAIQEDVATTNPVTFKQNGQTVIFDIVNTSAEFNTAMNDGSNVVIVNNDLQFSGTQTLADNKYITGQNYEYATDKFINVTGKESIPTLTAANNSDLFVVGKNTTLRDMTLTVTPVTSEGAPYYAVTNNNGASVGNLVIDNITTNAPILIKVENGSKDSVINITNSTFNMDATLWSDGDAAIKISTFNGSTVNIPSITGNTITFGDNVVSGSGISFSANDNSTQFIENVTNNTVTFGDNIANINKFMITVNGIYFNNLGTGSTQTIGNVNNNKVTFGDNVANSSASANGMYFNNKESGSQTINAVNSNMITFGNFAGGKNGSHISGINFSVFNGTQKIESVDNNTLIFGANTLIPIGINFDNESNQVMGSIDGNTIIFGNNAYEVTGIFISSGADSNNDQAIVSVNDNTVTFGNYSMDAAGIEIYFVDGTQNVNNVSGNTITFGELSNTNDASYGIAFYAYRGTQSLSNVSNNTITFNEVPSGSATGLYFITGLNATINVSTITDNALLGATGNQGIYIDNTNGNINIYILGNEDGQFIRGIPDQQEALSRNNNNIDVTIEGNILMTE